MKFGIAMLLLLGMPSLHWADQKATAPAACQDEEAMATDYQKSLTDLVATVQKESQTDFERTYHRKSCLTKLTLCVGVVEGLAACFDKAAQDSATPKSQAGTYKAKRDSYMKFHDKIIQYRDSLKTTENEKSAKQQIEKFDLTN